MATQPSPVAAAVAPSPAEAPLPDPRIAALRISFQQLQNSYHSRSLALSSNEREAYDAIGARLIQHYLPQNPEELRLIAAIQNYEWLRARNLQIQINLLRFVTNRKMDEVAALFPQYSADLCQSMAQAVAYLDQLKVMGQLSREMGSLTGLIEKARKELALLVSAREGTEDEAEQSEELELETEQAGVAETAHSDEPGFVPTDPGSVRPSVPERQPRIKMPRFAGPNKKADRKAWLRAMRKRLAA